MKRLYEGASAITGIFFVLLVALGFLFKTKEHKDAVRHRNHHERKMEKAHEKNEARRKAEQEYFEKQQAKIRRDAEEALNAEKEHKEGCHSEDHNRLEMWESYYQNLMEHNRTYGNFNRANELEAPPPLDYNPSYQWKKKESTE